MIYLLIWILIFALIFALFWWILGMIPIPPQFKWIINVVVAIIFLIMILEILTGGLHLAPFTYPIR